MHLTRKRLLARALISLIAMSWLVGCSPYEWRHQIQRSSRSQIWLSERSQVRIRNAQSRNFDTTDKLRMIEAIVTTCQDLGFQIEVLDETLGIISGKKFLDAERPTSGELATYLLYDEESLVVLNRSYRTWGPFYRRSDLVRLTITVRQRNAEQLIVRASAQHYLRPIEAPEAYLAFFAALEKALLVQRTTQSPDASPESS